jgi:hypothetical protein
MESGDEDGFRVIDVDKDISKVNLIEKIALNKDSDFRDKEALKHFEEYKGIYAGLIEQNNQENIEPYLFFMYKLNEKIAYFSDRIFKRKERIFNRGLSLVFDIYQTRNPHHPIPVRAKRLEEVAA